MITNDNKNPNEKDIKLILGLFNTNKISEAKKKLDEALESYNKAIEIDPNYAQAYNNLGIAFQKLNRINEAVFNYKKAISLKTDFAEAFNNLGTAMMLLNNTNEALKFFDKSLQIKSDYAEVYNCLGNLYEDF